MNTQTIDATAVPIDFEIESIAGGIGYTPMSYEAYDWCRKNLSNCVQWGRTYLMTEKRGTSLRGHLSHKEGFATLLKAA